MDSVDGRSSGELAPERAACQKGAANLVGADTVDRARNPVGPPVRMETRAQPRNTEGNAMSMLAGLYLYGTACFLFGFAVGVTWESGR